MDISFVSDLSAFGEEACGSLFPELIAPVLIAAFGIAVGFVAYKLIKRALNKA